MKCNSCNYENETDFPYCPNCGAEQTKPAENGVKSIALRAFGDKLFLALCILFSAAGLSSLVSGEIPVIIILLTVFLWLVYADSRRGVADAGRLRCVSGTVYADYIISTVLFWVCVVSTAIITVVCIFVPQVALESDAVGIVAPASSVINGFLQGSFMAIAVLAVVFVVIVLLLNMLGLRKIHRFVKSFYRSMQSDDAQIEYAANARKWLIVFGIVNAVNALSALSSFSFAGFISKGCISAAMIVATVLIKKYILTPEN